MRPHLCVRVGVMWLMTTSIVNAQPAATSFDDLRTLLKTGDRIVVTDDTGRRTGGRLGELTSASLQLLVPKTEADGRQVFVPARRLLETEVRRVQLERRDSLLNGTLIGLAPGAALAVLAGVGVGSDCGWGRDYCARGPNELFFEVLAFAGGIGAATGALIDWARYERATVYDRQATRTSRVTLSWAVDQSTRRVALSVRF